MDNKLRDARELEAICRRVAEQTQQKVWETREVVFLFFN
jgi:hypothetical protein